MARLFAQTGRSDAAARHYVFAGDSKALEALAEGLPERPLKVDGGLLSERPWERVAAYAYVAAGADLVVDEDARWWCSTAFAEISRDPGEWRAFAPNPWLAAFKTFGRLAALASVEEASTFLEFSRPLIARDPKTYRHTDEAQVEAAIAIGLAHPHLLPTVLDMLLAAKVGSAAQAGDFNAALAVAEAGGDVESAIPEARRRRAGGRVE
jgi:hypothetical protein